MDERKEWIINGFAFFNQQHAEQAWQERRKIEYLDQHMDMENSLPEDVLTIYEKLIHDEMFRTPVGITYLQHLQTMLRMNDQIEDDLIPPIPLHLYYDMSSQVETDKHHPVDEELQETDAQNQNTEQMIIKKEGNDPPSSIQKQSTKKPYPVLLIVNVILVVMVLVMFFIALSGNQPNILNYRRVITDEYANWEQELTEREAQLREKEKEIKTGENQ